MNNLQQNGKRAVCPATVSVVIDVLSKWECNRDIRELALKCFALMAIVLQRTSPEEVSTATQFQLIFLTNNLTSLASNRISHYLSTLFGRRSDVTEKQAFSTETVCR